MVQKYSQGNTCSWEAVCDMREERDKDKTKLGLSETILDTQTIALKGNQGPPICPP